MACTFISFSVLEISKFTLFYVEATKYYIDYSRCSHFGIKARLEGRAAPYSRFKSYTSVLHEARLRPTTQDSLIIE